MGIMYNLAFPLILTIFKEKMKKEFVIENQTNEEEPKHVSNNPFDEFE